MMMAHLRKMKTTIPLYLHSLVLVNARLLGDERSNTTERYHTLERFNIPERYNAPEKFNSPEKFNILERYNRPEKCHLPDQLDTNHGNQNRIPLDRSQRKVKRCRLPDNHLKRYDLRKPKAMYGILKPEAPAADPREK